MKSPDKDIDRALQEALKRKFDDFEAETTKALEDAIFRKQRVAYWQSAGGRALLAGGSIIILLSLPFLYFAVSDVKEVATINIPVKNSLNAARKLMKKAIGVDYQADVINSVAKENKMNQPANSTINQKVATKTGKSILLATPLPKAVKPVQKVKTVQKIIDSFLVPDSSEELKMSPGFRIPEGYLISSNYMENGNSSSSENKGLLIPYNLEIIAKRPYQEYHFQPTLKIEPNINTLESDNSKASKVNRDFAFILNVIPLNTTQILTVKSLPGIIYQNVSVPSEISLNRLGYKFAAGLAKGAFQFVFSYGQLNQSFRYEIASDEFVLEKDSKGYGFVPKGVQYRQDNKLKFVGLGLKRHGVIKNESVFQNYFGDVGIEFSRELKTKTSVLWGNIAIGKQVTLSKNSQLNIGPFVEYSFTKMVNPDTRFQIRPYQIGLSIGLTYSKK